MTLDEKLKDELIHQTLSLFRYSASQVQAVTKRLKELEKKLIAQLAEPLTSASTKAEINQIIKNADKVITEYYGGIQQEFDFGELGKTVSQRTVTSLEFVLGAEALTMPTDSYFASLASNVLIEGSPAAAWWSAQDASLTFKFAGQVRQGLANAETNQQIIARIVGTRTQAGIMEVAQRDAASLVQTSVQAVANNARLNVYKKNSDVIAGVRQVSTLDSHTSLICIAYSEQCWDLDGNPMRGTSLPFNGGPPRHFRCRSVLVPITKTFKELGVDIPEPKTSTRASDQGQISAATDFDAFLKRKGLAYQNEMLGIGRADLWRSGRITLRDLVDGQGRPLTTEELTAKFAKH